MANGKTCTPLTSDELALARLVTRATCLDFWPKSLDGSMKQPTEVWSHIGTAVDQVEAVLETEESELLTIYPILSLESFRVLVKNQIEEDGGSHEEEDDQEAEKLHEAIIATIGQLRLFYQLFKSGKLQQSTYRRVINGLFSQKRLWTDVFNNRLFLSVDRLLAQDRVTMAMRDIIAGMAGQPQVWSRLVEVTKPGYNPPLSDDEELSPDSPWVKREKTNHWQLRQGLFLFLGTLSEITLNYRYYYHLSCEIKTSFDRMERLGAIREMQEVLGTAINIEVATELEPVANFVEDALVGLEKSGKTYFDVLKEYLDAPEVD